MKRWIMPFICLKIKKDETKRTVMEYFKQLKFYSDNPFAFLDVHNEKLFFKKCRDFERNRANVAGHQAQK